MLNNFRWNKHFRHLFLLYGDFDGHTVHVRPRAKLWKVLIIIYLICTSIRHLVAVFFLRSEHAVIAFYLSNFTFYQGYAFSFFHMIIISIVLIWTWFLVQHYQKMNYRQSYLHWLSLLPPDNFKKVTQKKTSLNPKSFGIDFNTQIRLQTLFYRVGEILRILLILNCITLTMLCSVYYWFTFQSLHEKISFFWATLAFNTFYMLFCSYYCLQVVVGSSFIFYYIAHLICLRLKNLRQSMEQLANQLFAVHSSKFTRRQESALIIDQQRLNSVLSDVFLVNQFWSAILGVNYLACVVAITLHLILVYVSTVFVLQIAFGFLIFSIYFFSFTLPLFIAGEVKWQVRFFLLSTITQ